MNKLFLVIVALFMVTALASGRTIPINDVSDAGSPITLSGSCNFDSSSSTLDVMGHNNSSQAILAVVVLVSVIPVGQMDSSHDHYFTAMPVADVGRDFDATDSMPISLGRGDAAKIGDAGTAKVLWVQFLDGTTWGDKAVETKAFSDRQAIVAYMKRLLSVYRSSGGDALLAAVKVTQTGAPEVMAELYRDKYKTAEELVTTINRQLAVAATRK
jgi:hypothetical protein